jgi:two-component system OmpR family response regulator
VVKDYERLMTQSTPSTPPAAPHILIVEDDRDTRELVSRFLKQNGFRVTAVGDGRMMRKALADGRFDLVILDLMLPGEDGLSLCRDLRARQSLPIIMVTAKGEETDRIVGLEVGADDYLPKPFNPRELLARIRAVLRRFGSTAQAAPSVPGGKIYRFDRFELDSDRRDVRDETGNSIGLTAGEYDLLFALVQRPGRTLSRDQLLDLVGGRDAQAFDRAVDAQICRLRRKIEPDDGPPKLIKTIRAGGYVLTAPVDVIGA